MTATLLLSRQLPDRDDLWRVTCCGVTVGSIVVPGNCYPDEVWGWSITVRYRSGLVNKNGREATREAAMAAFRRAWDIYRDEIGEEGWNRHVAHEAEVDARAEASRRKNAPDAY